MDFKSLSINQLLNKLHDSILSFAKGMDKIIDINQKAASTEQINELITHLQLRLKNDVERADDQKIINLLELLSKDQSILKLVKEDAAEWISTLNAIDEHTKRYANNYSEENIARIQELSDHIKVLARK